MSTTTPKKSTKISMSVLPRLFCFIAFAGVSQRWEFKNTTKNVLPKIVSKGLYKKSTKKIQNRFCFVSIFFKSCFWAFLGEGSSKTRQKNSKKKLTSPGTFLASEEPTNHVGHVGVGRFTFIFECPLPIHQYIEF
jgi:hypothetical protein